MSTQSVSELRTPSEATKLMTKCIEAIQAELRCGICYSTIKSPMMTTCYHMFCSECFTSCLRQMKGFSCPICKQKINRRGCSHSSVQEGIIESYKQLARCFKRDVAGLLDTKKVVIPKELMFMESQAIISDSVPSPLRDFSAIVQKTDAPMHKRKRANDSSMRPPWSKRSKVSPSPSSLLPAFAFIAPALPPVRSRPAKMRMSTVAEDDEVIVFTQNSKSVQCDVGVRGEDVRGCDLRGLMEKESGGDPLSKLFALLPGLEEILVENSSSLLSRLGMCDVSSMAVCRGSTLTGPPSTHSSQHTPRASHPRNAAGSLHPEASIETQPFQQSQRSRLSLILDQVTATPEAEALREDGVDSDDGLDISLPDTQHVLREQPVPAQVADEMPVSVVSVNENMDTGEEEEKAVDDMEDTVAATPSECSAASEEVADSLEAEAKDVDEKACVDANATLCVEGAEDSFFEEVVFTRVEEQGKEKEQLLEEEKENTKRRGRNRTTDMDSSPSAWAGTEEWVELEGGGGEKDRVRMVLTQCACASREHEDLLSDFRHLFPFIRFVASPESGATHIIHMGTDADLRSTYKSVKLAFGVALRCTLLSRQWAETCVREKKLLSYCGLTVAHPFSPDATPAWKAAVQSKRGLFDAINFYLPADMASSQCIKREMLQSLICLCGGREVDRPWRLGSNGFIIFRQDSDKLDDATRFEKDTGCQVLSAAWVLDSICEYRVIRPTHKYRTLSQH